MQIALRVAGHLLRAELACLAAHAFAREFGGGYQIDLIALDGPAAHVRRIIGFERLAACVGRGEGLNSTQERWVNALGAAHERVVEEVIEAARRVFPARALHLTGLLFAVVVIALGLVIVIARLRRPARVHQSVERPVRQVHALDGVGHGFVLERVGRPPQLAVPRADDLARFRFGDLKRQYAFGANHVVGFVVVDDGGGAAELARFGLFRGIENADRLARIALNHALGARPSARLALHISQRGNEVVFDHIARLHAGHCFRCDGHRCFGAAKPADEFLLRRIPHRLAAAGDATVFAARGFFGGGGCGVGGCADVSHASVPVTSNLRLS